VLIDQWPRRKWSLPLRRDEGAHGGELGRIMASLVSDVIEVKESVCKRLNNFDLLLSQERTEDLDWVPRLISGSWSR
jgi:hypothetical protein